MPSLRQLLVTSTALDPHGGTIAEDGHSIVNDVLVVAENDGDRIELTFPADGAPRLGEVVEIAIEVVDPSPTRPTDAAR